MKGKVQTNQKRRLSPVEWKRKRSIDGGTREERVTLLTWSED